MTWIWKWLCHTYRPLFFQMTSFLLPFIPRNLSGSRSDDVPLLCSISSMAPLGLGQHLNSLTMALGSDICPPFQTSVLPFAHLNSISYPYRSTCSYWNTIGLCQYLALYTYFFFSFKSKSLVDHSLIPSLSSLNVPSIQKSLWLYIYYRSDQAMLEVSLYLIYSYPVFLFKGVYRKDTIKMEP